MKPGNAMKLAEQRFNDHRARQKYVNALRSEWVLESEMTAAELLAKRDEMREAMYARNPHLRVDAA